MTPLQAIGLPDYWHPFPKCRAVTIEWGTLPPALCELPRGHIGNHSARDEHGRWLGGADAEFGWTGERNPYWTGDRFVEAE